MFLIGISLYSCKKETPPIIDYRIKTETNNNVTYQYSYLTPSGRIWYRYKNGYKYYSYHYAGDSIVETNYDYSGPGPPSKITYFINKEGYIIGNSFNQVYAYDSDWHKQEPANAPNQYVYQYENGNQMNISMNYVHDTTWFTYTYYPDKLENRTKGLRAFLGSGNRNLMKSEHIVSTAAGTVNSEYSYEFDAKGRVIKETRIFTSSLGTTPVVTTYTYFD